MLNNFQQIHRLDSYLNLYIQHTACTDIHAYTPTLPSESSVSTLAPLLSKRTTTLDGEERYGERGREREGERERGRGKEIERKKGDKKGGHRIEEREEIKAKHERKTKLKETLLQLLTINIKDCKHKGLQIR